MPAAQWARLQEDVNCQLRRGAWYKLSKLTPVEAVVEVKGKQIAVPRRVLQILPTPVLHWTVVPSPHDAPRFPTSWGPRYAVCPNCRDRAPLQGQPTTMRCHRCNGLFEVAWNEPYLAVG